MFELGGTIEVDRTNLQPDGEFVNLVRLLDPILGIQRYRDR